MTRRAALLILVLIAIGGSIYILEKKKVRPAPDVQNSEIPLELSTSTLELAQSSQTASDRLQEKSKKYERAKEISTPDGFINGDGVSIGKLIGKKVILIDFWTYSCINCQRTTPYLNSWYEKYKDKGLEIIGIHTPEFEFEKKYDNVKAAVIREGIKYPVVLDNDYSTWRAYRNQFWPRKYLIDIDGFIVYNHAGEGAYGETEREIQRALEERMRVLDMKGEIAKDLSSPQTSQVDLAKLGSPEIYFGAGRNTSLGNGDSQRTGPQTLAEPASVQKNKLYLVGNWQFEEEYAENQGSNTKIIFRYQARDVYMVASSLEGVRAKILIDGKPALSLRGSDVDAEGSVLFKDERLYYLIHNPAGYQEHTLEILIEDKSLRAFTFTFG
ncbi:MAG: redoxin family protein [Candidatus Ryanbacteria bacterium]|nr:redoxin family protein [Candidatus Ryanbacteria bacterium]